MNNHRKVKRDLKIAEWKDIFAQQAQSGQTKYEWCNERGITKDQFYYWQRIVREAMIEDATNPESETSLISQGTKVLPRFARINSETSSVSGSVAINMRLGNAEFNIMNGAEAGVIESTLLMVSKIC